ncbi:MAG: AMP-binding protein, partial [Pyrinomonadaceae bacterium]
MNFKHGGDWVHIAGEAIEKRIRAVAMGLAELGVKKGDRVALLSENRPEWSIVDLAVLSLGAVNVPIYTTQAPDQVRYILEDSGARLLFVSGRKVYRHARAGIEGAAQVEKIIFFDAATEGEIAGATLTLEDLERRGAEHDRLAPGDFDRLLGEVGADDLATIIYTSGTTGEPKGVMLTHTNLVTNLIDSSGHLSFSSKDSVLSVLPYSHVLERLAMYMYLHHGMSVFYAESMEKIGDNVREVRPTILI